MSSELDYYEISMRQFAQQILPAGYPTTTVWGYGAVASSTPAGRGLLVHNAPSLTIEAQFNRPVRVKRSTRPTPAQCRSSRTCTGAVGVGDESDGYAEAWYLPNATNIPPGYATEGTWRNFFSGKAATAFGVAWGPGFSTFQYQPQPRLDHLVSRSCAREATR